MRQSALRITVLQNFKCPTHPSFKFGDSAHCLFLKLQCWNGNEGMLATGLVGCSNKLKPWMWMILDGRRLHLKWVCSMSIMCLSWTILFMMHWVYRVEMEGGGRLIKHWHSVLQLLVRFCASFRWP